MKVSKENEVAIERMRKKKMMDINISKEYEKILKKESKLSAKMRDMVSFFYHYDLIKEEKIKIK